MQDRRVTDLVSFQAISAVSGRSKRVCPNGQLRAVGSTGHVKLSRSVSVTRRVLMHFDASVAFEARAQDPDIVGVRINSVDLLDAEIQHLLCHSSTLGSDINHRAMLEVPRQQAQQPNLWFLTVGVH
jgi:hypothetical protein